MGTGAPRSVEYSQSLEPADLSRVPNCAELRGPDSAPLQKTVLNRAGNACRSIGRNRLPLDLVDRVKIDKGGSCLYLLHRRPHRLAACDNVR